MVERPKSALQPVHFFLLALSIGALLTVWWWPVDPKPSEQTLSPAPEPVAVAEEPAVAMPAVEEPPIAETDIETPVIEAPEPEEATPPEPEPVTPQPTAANRLPSLNNSDQDILKRLADSQWQGALSYGTQEYIVRKVVRAVVAASAGEWVNQHQPFKAPSTPFVTAGSKTQLRISERNFERYTPYIKALTAMPPEEAAAVYRHYAPLLEEAYAELGIRGSNFHTQLLGAIDQLLRAPPATTAELVQPSVMYRYKDEALEALPEIRKVMIRMGPANQAALSQWLINFRKAL